MCTLLHRIPILSLASRRHGPTLLLISIRTLLLTSRRRGPLLLCIAILLLTSRRRGPVLLPCISILVFLLIGRVGHHRKWNFCFVLQIDQSVGNVCILLVGRCRAAEHS